MSLSLKGKRVALLVTDGFEQVEMTEPKKALEQAGARAEVLSAKKGQVRGWHHDKPGDSFTVDGTFDTAQVENYDAIVLPGGVMNSDTIRTNDAARTLVQAAEKSGKPIAVICHGAWLLVSAGLVKGKTITSWPSLQDDIRNAGGDWQDQAVVRDGNLISSRKPDDLPAFNQALLESLAA
ncbi:type 1 glutamine amidotransferase domain-containing protein [Aquipseudomonas alcaligenes]|uniref:type 1 glutamine amidotransferase domain-containing protein n=1 Tax=Aquipseudomonas alcaligenes TaxID=43263 RepID=UPI003749EF74